MSRMARVFPVAVLIAMTLCGPATLAEAQIPAHIRVVTNSERIMRWLGPESDVIFVAQQGTILEVLDFDQEKNHYWVVLPRDLHGTRKAGWIRAAAVEPYVASPASDASPTAAQELPLASPSEAQRDGGQAQALVAPPTSAPAAAEEGVTIAVRRDAPATSVPVEGARKSYAFEDVHFERDRYSIRTEDIDRLRAVAAALSADPSLVVTIEGHTCSLGPGAYNVALGNRRANAVKDYLVSAGVPAARLLTVSQGEADAAFDNSREDTRRLNRRVVLVPKTQR